MSNSELVKINGKDSNGQDAIFRLEQNSDGSINIWITDDRDITLGRLSRSLAYIELNRDEVIESLTGGFIEGVQRKFVCRVFHVKFYSPKLDMVMEETMTAIDLEDITSKLSKSNGAIKIISFEDLTYRDKYLTAN